MKNAMQYKIVNWLPAAIYALLFFVIYSSALRWLVVNDWEREGYSYCYLIPFVVAFLLWLKRDEFKTTASHPSFWGLAAIAMGGFFLLFGELTGILIILYLSMWLVVVGLCWLHFGWKKLRVIGFPLFFILTMFPLPAFLNIKIMLQLRLISTALGVKLIELFGLPVYCEGNVIHLSFTRLQVVDACSGLHSLITLVVLCLLLVYFFRDHLWKRLVFFISSVPLAIATNSLRIALTAVLHKFFGADVAEGFFHSFSGVFIFLFNIPLLILEMKILEKLPPVRKRLHARKLKTDDGIPDSIQAAVTKPLKNKHRKPGSARILQPVFISGIAVLCLMLVFSSSIEVGGNVPIKKPMTSFPLSIGEWQANNRQGMAQEFLDVLDFSDYALINYRNSYGKTVSFYAAYYESQTRGKSIHSPETCLPGSGWEFKEAGKVQISLQDAYHGSMTVNRALIQSGANKELVYYWFSQRGRILTNAYQLKLYNFWDALTMKRTDGALIRLITPIGSGEAMEEADARLREFTIDLTGVIKDYIPGRQT